MSDNKREICTSPVTTPGSFIDEERYLVPHSYHPHPKLPWYKKYPPPRAVIIISVLQLIFYGLSDESLKKQLRYEPNNQNELWRFLTYMLLHGNVYHLIQNVLIQCLFAVTLEKTQGTRRVIVLYLSGGATGALGAACVQPDPVVGASAGVYALLISHIAHIILNFENTKYKLYRCLCVVIIVASDVIYNLLHSYSKGEPVISWGAHVAGAFTGFLFGLIIYKSTEDHAKSKNRIAFWIGLIFFIFLLITLVSLNLQVRRCTTAEFLRIRYVYFC